MQRLLLIAAEQRSKSAKEMATELKAKWKKNSVVFFTADKKIHIDLDGKPHYDKSKKEYIPTPHVQAHAIHTSFYGKSRVSKIPDSTEPASADDIRLARKVAGVR